MGSGRWEMSFGARAGMGVGSVYARHRLDLSVKDILFGILSCGRHWRGEKLEAEVLRLCSLEDEGLVCFSVRSGWDLWLGAQGLRAGDEVLVSAVTHPDMVRIIRQHGLRAIPVDIAPETLAPRPRMLEAAITPRTRVVLVAHLFGGRMDLGGVATFARERGLLLVEDCAQAFQGPERMGDPAADVSMYSFGTLKTSTALGGAVLRVRDREVLCRMRGIQAVYPSQGRGGYLKKLLEVLGLVAVSRPCPYGLLAGACTRVGSDIDALVNGAVRAFPQGEPAATFFLRLRQRPSAPLLAMLSRRLRTFDGQRLARRASSGERFASRLRVRELHPGRHSLQRTHWLFPVVVADPGALILGLRRHGLDASQATSSIAVVAAPPGRSSPPEASLMMSGVVFLPVYPEIPLQALDVMAGLVKDCAVVEAVESMAL
ncbi:MAG: aminotransferase class V-fold PLP-dependent enzyme [Rubrobacteraceae bacterium]|nr:aminotransferase class V-fold PLP-dependent enzyme [Rubrobacteraceae bacterium]